MNDNGSMNIRAAEEAAAEELTKSVIHLLKTIQ